MDINELSPPLSNGSCEIMDCTDSPRSPSLLEGLLTPPISEDSYQQIDDESLEGLPSQEINLTDKVAEWLEQCDIWFPETEQTETVTQGIPLDIINITDSFSSSTTCSTETDPQEKILRNTISLDDTVSIHSSQVLCSSPEPKNTVDLTLPSTSSVQVIEHPIDLTTVSSKEKLRDQTHYPWSPSQNLSAASHNLEVLHHLIAAWTQRVN